MELPCHFPVRPVPELLDGVNFMKDFIPYFSRIGGIREFKNRIQTIPLRIMVEGTRGKSSTVTILEEFLRDSGRRTLAKTTGEDPIIINNGNLLHLLRKRDTVLLDYDNIPVILSFDVDAFIYENQAITPYTMRYMHKILRPEHVLIPNIRIDHEEGLGLDLDEMTRSFADNYRMMKYRKEVYYVEPIRKVHDLVFPILQRYEERYPDLITLHDVTVPESLRRTPGVENVCIAAFFMNHVLGFKADTSKAFARIREKLAFRTSPDGIRYLNLAKVNDPVSFVHMMRYMLGQTDEDVALVAYFRRDRAGRTLIFEDFFPEINQRFGRRIKRIWLAGYGTSHAFKHMPAELQQITEIIDSDRIEDILSFVREHQLVLIPIINRVNEFMDQLIDLLEEPEEAKKIKVLYDFDLLNGLQERKIE